MLFFAFFFPPLLLMITFFLTTKLQDRYKVSVFKVALFPPRYRKALIVALVFGFTQGIILVFFNRYICHNAETEAAKSVCEEDAYDPSEGILWLLLLNFFTIGPAIFFLYKLERINLFPTLFVSMGLNNKKMVAYGRVKLIIYGTIAAIATLIAIQVFTRISRGGPLINWRFYVIQGLTLFYTIFIQAATLGPVL